MFGQKEKGIAVLPAEVLVQTEILPGTEIMTDVPGARFVHAHNATSATVLVPQPTDDPHDPLNWSRWWKLAVTITQGAFVMISVITNLSIAPLTPIYIAEWGKSLSQIALLTGVCVLTLGYANFVIVPCSDVFGRRPTTIVCALLGVAANVWQASAHSYNSFLGARAFAGIGAAANESMMPIVMADIYFLHQRGKFVGIYFWCYFIGLMLGPIISGAVAQHTTWRWFFWACTIAQGLNFVALCLFFPETRRLEVAAKSVIAPDQQLTGSIDADYAGDTKTGTEAFHHETLPSALSVEEGIRTDQYLGRGRPSKSQLGISQSPDRKALRAIVLHIITPIELFFFPIVFWAAMTMGGAANALLDVNLTQSQVFMAPPYNFAPSSVGYANFALVVGGMIGLAVAGPWSDWVAARATKKNNGIREPEMRLPALIPFIIAAIVGLTVCGVGYQKHWPWEAIIIVGFGLVGVQVVAIPTIVTTYAIDCYRPVAGQILVISTVCKNTFGFGMTYYINDWAIKSGFIPPLMLLMAITCGFATIGLVFFTYFGKTMRRMTRNAKVHEL
ncbi:hypothetical protein B0A49_11454 [Cryomyces minteri]|uniref:Major facilitator superfamily (MFS) profile domain-containing protein n=1 Tax=Cryomyces minteri TaxID=331657 RepID=A0A4U0W0M9_9PEZI|nr:hypothetical protein B0A49_11454 [Cryomyces minteri]